MVSLVFNRYMLVHVYVKRFVHDNTFVSDLKHTIFDQSMVVSVTILRAVSEGKEKGEGDSLQARGRSRTRVLTGVDVDDDSSRIWIYLN